MQRERRHIPTVIDPAQVTRLPPAYGEGAGSMGPDFFTGGLGATKL